MIVKYQCFSLLLAEAEDIACLAETLVHLLTVFQLNLQLFVQYACALRCASYPLSCHTEGYVGSEFIVNQHV